MNSSYQLRKNDQHFNEQSVVLFKKFPHAQNIPLPSYATSGSAGLDLVAIIDEEIFLLPGQRLAIPTGLGIELPIGWEAQIRPRSGLALNHGITCLNAPGTIDSDYRGEIKIILINHGHKTFNIQPGYKIAQMVIAEYKRIIPVEVESLDESSRGSGGFGSTGMTV